MFLIQKFEKNHVAPFESAYYGKSALQLKYDILINEMKFEREI